MPSPRSRASASALTVSRLFDCAVERPCRQPSVRDGEMLAEQREEGREQAAPSAAGDRKPLCRCRHRSPRAVDDRRHHRAGQLHRRARRPRRSARAWPWRSTSRWPAFPRRRRCSRSTARMVGSRSPRSTRISATGSAPADDAPFVASTEALAAKLAGKPCRIIGPQAETLAPLLPDAVAQAALPDPALIARLAVVDGIEAWRSRNRTEGLPRPLYLRGVNVTSPDGTRRTVETE